MDEPVRVLHVDDDPDFADLTATVLEREDERFVVETAANADEALDRLTDDVDCVVSDYDMPGMDGIAFLETVREDHPDLPFVLFTGKGGEAVASDAISAGVTDYLQKEAGTDQYAVLANRIGNAVDRYRSRVALEASQKRLSLFIEQSPLGVVEWDDEFNFVHLNDAAERILGYTETELAGRSWEAIVPDDDRRPVGEVVDGLLAAEGGFHSVNENVRKDGERIVCEWHNRVVTDDGETVAIFSQFQDITERTEREERLRETTARLEALFENSPDMINVHDDEGNVLDPNPRLCERTGYDAEELVGMKVWDLDRSIDPGEARALWAGMEVGDRRRLAGEYRRRDGSTFPVEVHVSRLDLEGNDRFLAISRDVTDSAERERRLERYETIVETIDDAAFVVDDDRSLGYANETAVEAVDASSDEVVGREVVSLVRTYVADDEDPGRFAEALERAFDADDTADVPERTVLTLDIDGDEMVFEYQFSPIVEDGTTGAVAVTARNVTDRVERERTLERQNERLEEFASVVSHDLRNPLNVAEGRLELAREECGSEHLDDVASAHDRMEALIDHILTLAREGCPVDATEPVDVAEYAEQCWRNVRTDGATLVVDTDRTIHADPDRFQQLLENLVRNSVEHSSTGSRAEPGDAVEHGSTDPTAGTGGDGVTVTVADLDGGFYVADDGPGIPEPDRERVFESAYSTVEGGTGFGLAIVKRIVEAHGWEIRVTGSESGGARFDVTGVSFVDG